MVHDPVIVITGAVLSIHDTIAVALPVLPYVSVNVNSYVQLPVNIYVHELVIVTHVLLNHVIVAVTS